MLIFMANFLFFHGSPGLMYIGDNSCSRGHGFKSKRRILDGHFSYLSVVKFVLFV